MAKADDLKAKIGLGGPPLARIDTAPPAIPDHQMVRRIGSGSYGDVWLACNAVGTWRAVKVVYRAHFKDARPYEREFSGIQKYEPISRTNDGLVDVLQLGRNDTDGYFYYIMELADDAGPVVSGPSSAVSGPQPPFRPEAYAPKTLGREIQQRGRLPIEECITLGLTLNLALGHLHRSGLIHRDVKPSNIIFVNGVPKLADIGLVTELAEAQSFVGTEGFIPPEGPNSPQADIFALGKVLYEASMGKDRHEFPEPASGLGTDVESRALMELNAVLLKACAPNPKQRYHSAEEMNADLALLHSGQSVKDKHALERRLKFTTRTAMAVFAVLVLAVVPYYLAIKEKRLATAAAKEEAAARILAQDRARQAKETEAQATAILEFFQRHVLAVARPKGEPNAMSRDVTVREALVEAEKQISNNFSNQPMVEAQLRATLGETFWYLGDVERAIAQIERSLELFRARLGPNERHSLSAMNNLEVAYEHIGQFEKALPLAKETVERMKKLQGTKSRETLVTMHGLAYLYHQMGRDEEALPLEQETLRLRKGVLGPADSDTLSSMDGLALIYRSLGQLSNALALCEETVAIARTNLPPDDPMTLIAMGNLASAYRVAGRIKDALPLHKEVLERKKIIYGPDAPQTLTTMHNLATSYLMNGDIKEAIALHEDTLRLRRLKLPPNHPEVFYSMQNLAAAYNADGRRTEAIALAKDTVDGRQKKLGPDHPDTLVSMSSLAVYYQEDRQFSEAIQLAEKVFTLAGPKLGRDHPSTLEYLHKLAFAYLEAGQLSNAIPRFQEAVQRNKTKYGATAPATLDEMRKLAGAYSQAGQLAESAGVWRDLVQTQKSAPPPDDLSLANSLAQLVLVLLQQDKSAAAEQPARECLELREKRFPDDWQTFNSRSQLGDCLVGLKNYAEAEPLLLSGYEGMKQREDKIPPAGRPRLKEALQHLTRLYAETDRSDQAAEWKRKLAEFDKAEAEKKVPDKRL